jgi:hypothetical protein
MGSNRSAFAAGLALTADTAGQPSRAIESEGGWFTEPKLSW